MNPRELWTFANALTAFRLCVAVPLMLACTVAGTQRGFFWVLVASFASDAIDGTVARLTGQTSAFGAMLDSWADVAAYAAIAIGVTQLWPELAQAAWPAFVAIVVSFVLPGLVAFARFRRFTSYHTWLVKLAVAAVAVALLLALSDGPHWPLSLAAALAVLAAGEEIAITCIIDAPRADIRGLLTVLHARRG